jgi:lysophospholipase L1-like esterase
MRDDPAAVMWRLRPLLDAHQISRPKAPDEFRVAVLGDSGTFDFYDRSEDAVPGQMTRLGARIGGRRIVAYNLAYKKANSLAALLILEHATTKHPDAVVWFVTLSDLAVDEPTTAWENDVHIIVRVNREELPELVRRYGVSTWETRRLVRKESLWDRSLIVRGAGYRDYVLLLTRSLLDDLSGGDPTESVRERRPWVGSYALPQTADFVEKTPSDPPLPNSRWRNLATGAEIARQNGIRLLIVNEPTFIASGRNAEREYNSYYGRTFYDRYRRVLQEYCGKNEIPYLDLWNRVPPSEYSDTPGHYTPAGNARIARVVMETLSEVAR